MSICTAAGFWHKLTFSFAAVLISAAASQAFAAETQRYYLSGKGKDDPVRWDFTCSAGQHANTPSTIGVPSNWELQGFGTYTYGRDKEIGSGVQGIYHRKFTLPESWSSAGEKTYLVFEGVMTDTQATINGQPAGPKHEGGFYRFRYNITKLLKPGENDIQVTVNDESENPSVNKAERRGDFWNFAGIYRPVYLEAFPAQSIDHLAINAQANGDFTADLALDGLAQATADNAPWTLEAQLSDTHGQNIGGPIVQKIENLGATPIQFSHHFDNPQLWTAETPNLYQIEFRLKQGDAVIHSVRQRFGFRTLEVRNPGPGVTDPGLFLNGNRILFKGVCRHSFWPDSGRCLSESLNRADVQLMKDMNLNAVRMSHYPPDQDFLDACDEAGLYVLDEIAGWHGHYDTPAGHKLVEEMVTRDVNHPSILFWDNGNEGGFNTEIDDDYAKFDPQKRAVLHPWALFRGIDTKHYPNWSDLQRHLAGDHVYFPTEMLHGLYDGGGGASLQDYWNLMLSSKTSAGGFIWAFLDEDVVRTDLHGKLDSRTNQAPDGVVGPYREKEGSFFAIKQIWSPIVITRNDDGKFTVENRYNFLDAATCSFTWEYRNSKGPNDQSAGYDVVATGKAHIEGALPPGKSAPLLLDTPPGDQLAHDCLAITARDATGRELWTWTWLLRDPWQNLVNMPATQQNPAVTAAETPTTIVLTNNAQRPTSLTISKSTGEMLELRGAANFYNGPRLVVGSGQLAGIDHHADGPDQLIDCTFNGDLKSLVYRLRPNGWMTIEYAYNLPGSHHFTGIGFDYSGEKSVRSIRYLGQGPFRVWKNRLAGGTMSVWDKPYNDTITGDVDQLAPGEKLVYPEFKGYYADVRWMQLNVAKGPVTILIHQPNTFVQFFAPQLPPNSLQGKTGVNFPGTDLSFLDAIPPVGSKFVPPSITGPQAQDPVSAGPQKGAISFFCGEFPK